MSGAHPSLCNVANVAFLEAAHPTEEKDTFRVYFGGADAVIGTAVIKVSYQKAGTLSDTATEQNTSLASSNQTYARRMSANTTALARNASMNATIPEATDGSQLSARNISESRVDRAQDAKNLSLIHI